MHALLSPNADGPTVHRVIAGLRDAGRAADADEVLEEWLGSHMTRNDHLTATRIIESLPDEWVCPRVRAMYYMSVR